MSWLWLMTFSSLISVHWSDSLCWILFHFILFNFWSISCVIGQIMMNRVQHSRTFENWFFKISGTLYPLPYSSLNCILTVRDCGISRMLISLRRLIVYVLDTCVLLYIFSIQGSLTWRINMFWCASSNWILWLLLVQHNVRHIISCH
jgi:hypothetical protein